MTRPTNLFILFSGIYLMNRAALKKKHKWAEQEGPYFIPIFAIFKNFVSLRYLPEGFDSLPVEPQ